MIRIKRTPRPGLGGLMRVVSGVQPSGRLHLENYLGAIRQFVALQDDPGNECSFFVADLHAMTSVHDGSELRSLTQQVATDNLALGLDPARAVIYRQSDLPEVTELAWMLSTVTPMTSSSCGRSACRWAATRSNTSR